MRVTARAPGKLVLSGEYAVLLGAPAIVLALNFPVSCRLTTPASGPACWQFLSRGFEGASRHRLADLMPGNSLPGQHPPEPGDPARLCWYLLRSLAQRFPAQTLSQLPESLHIEIDSRACFRSGAKLGVGSSAAVCCALTGALLACIGCYQPDAASEIALETHRAFQGGRGSGLDIAASMHGGAIEFKRTGSSTLPLVKPLAMPDNVHMTLIWTGRSADTTTHITDFFGWYHGLRKTGRSTVVDTLLQQAVNVADAFSTQRQWIDRLSDYISVMKTLDAEAQLGIYSADHRRLDGVAKDSGAVYKPCGAGGGDLGLALSRDRDALAGFSNTVSTEGFTVLPLELEQHGLETTID